MTASEFVHLDEKSRELYLKTMDMESQEYFDLSMNIEDLLKEIVQELMGDDEGEITEEMEETLMTMVEDLASFDESVAAILYLEPYVDKGEVKSFTFLKKALRKVKN